MQQVKAKKYLGQHFLKDLQVAQRIADCIEPNRHMPILEIGPGTGVLTQFLLQKPDFDLTAVEIDSESIAFLKTKFPNLHLIEADFLKLDLKELYGDEPFIVIGNYPYNISSQIFFKVLEFRDQIPYCAGMLQKEVAERFASKPGTKAYGITSVLLQAFYQIDYLFTVSEKVFDPPPKVKSAVIKLTRNTTQHLDCDEKLFTRVVKTAFNQRRKTLRNSMKPLISGADCSEAVFNKRPEQLSVDEFVDLTNLTEKKIGELQKNG